MNCVPTSVRRNSRGIRSKQAIQRRNAARTQKRKSNRHLYRICWDTLSRTDTPPLVRLSKEGQEIAKQTSQLQGAAVKSEQLCKRAAVKLLMTNVSNKLKPSAHPLLFYRQQLMSVASSLPQQYLKQQL